MQTDLLKQISEIFIDAELSIIKEVVYFDGWQSYEESGGILVFIGIDDAYYVSEYGYCVMAEDNTNYFRPIEFSKEEAYFRIDHMTNYLKNEHSWPSY